MIPKELFCEIIESITIQMIMDNSIGSHFIVNSGTNLNGTCSYDNKLYNPILKLLQLYFPKDKNGFCEIENYLDDFEGFSEDNYTPEKLYDKLLKLKTPN